VWARREGLEPGEAASMQGLNDSAHGLLSAAEAASHHGRRLALGPGEQDLAPAYCQGGRRPETGLQGGSRVRRERAYK